MPRAAAARLSYPKYPYARPSPRTSGPQAKHRRIRRWDVLWLVRAWAARWCALERRKQTRGAAYQAAVERPGLPEAERAGLEACLHALVEAESPEVRYLKPNPKPS